MPRRRRQRPPGSADASPVRAPPARRVPPDTPQVRDLKSEIATLREASTKHKAAIAELRAKLDASTRAGRRAEAARDALLDRAHREPSEGRQRALDPDVASLFGPVPPDPTGGLFRVHRAARASSRASSASSDAESCAAPSTTASRAPSVNDSSCDESDAETDTDSAPALDEPTEVRAPPAKLAPSVELAKFVCASIVSDLVTSSIDVAYERVADRAVECAKNALRDARALVVARTEHIAPRLAPSRLAAIVVQDRDAIERLEASRIREAVAMKSAVRDAHTVAHTARTLEPLKLAAQALDIEKSMSTALTRLADAGRGSPLATIIADPVTAIVAASSVEPLPSDALRAIRKVQFGDVALRPGANEHAYSAAVRAEAHRVATRAAAIETAAGAGEPFYAFASRRELASGEGASPTIVPRDLRNPATVMPPWRELKKRVIILEDVYYGLDEIIRKACPAPIVLVVQEGLPPLNMTDATTWYGRDGDQRSSYAGASSWTNPGVNLVDSLYVCHQPEGLFDFFARRTCFYQAVNILGPPGSGHVVVVLHPVKVIECPVAILDIVGRATGRRWISTDRSCDILIKPEVHGEFVVQPYTDYRGNAASRIRITDARSGAAIDMPRDEYEAARYATSGEKLNGAIGAVRKVLIREDGSCDYSIAKLAILSGFFKLGVVVKDPINIGSVYGGGTRERGVATQVLPPLLRSAHAPTAGSLDGVVKGVEKRIVDPSTRALKALGPSDVMEMYAAEFDAMAAEAIRREGVCPADLAEAVEQLTVTPAQKARMRTLLDGVDPKGKTIIAMSKREINHAEDPTDTARFLSPTRIDLTVSESLFTIPLYSAFKNALPFYAGGCTADQVACAVYDFHNTHRVRKSCVDVSKIDGSTLLSTRRKWRAFLKSCFAGMGYDKQLDKLLDEMESPTCCLYVNDDDLAIWFKSAGMILSGAPDTTLFGSWINARLTYVANRLAGMAATQAWHAIGPLTGDDSIKLDIPENVTVFRAYGYELTVEPQPCFRAPLTLVGIVVFDPAVTDAHVVEVRRTLIRATTSVSADDKRAAQFKVVGGALRSGNTPVLRELFAAYERALRRDGRWTDALKLSSLTRDEQFKLRAPPMRAHTSSEAAEARQYVGDQLNLTPREVGFLIDELKRANTFAEISQLRIDAPEFHSNLAGEKLCSNAVGPFTGPMNTCVASAKAVARAREVTRRMKANAAAARERVASGAETQRGRH